MPDVRYDVLQAAVIDESQPVATDPQGVRFRVRMLETLVEDRAFVQTTTRPMNIVIAAKKKGIEFGADSPLSRLEHSALESASGLELLEVLSSQQEALAAAAAGEQDEEAIRLLLNLRDPINKFFEETMVMVDEPEVRYARLTLMHATALQLLVAGDFTRIVQE
jgi:glycyl-tRNA synthetase beta chain